MSGSSSFDAFSKRLIQVLRTRHRFGRGSILIFLAFAVFLVAVDNPRSEAVGVAQSSQRPLAQCEFGRGWTEISDGFDLAGSGFHSPAFDRRVLAHSEPLRTSDRGSTDVAVRVESGQANVRFMAQRDDQSLQIIGEAPSSGAVDSYRFTFDVGCSGRIRFNVHERGSVLVSIDRPNGRVEYLGQVGVPWAVDTHGNELPTWFEVQDDVLVQRVDTRDASGSVLFDPVFTSIACTHQRAELNAFDALNLAQYDYPVYCPPVAMFWAANGWLPMWGYEANIANDYGKVLTQFPGGDACSPPGIETSVSYDFEVPCRMHDYCYALRKAGLSGTISDDDCDSAFAYVMEAHCNDRVFPLNADCRFNRELYYRAVRLPSVVTNANPGLITLRNINSLLCADVPGSSTSYGTVLIQWTCNSTPNQKFRIRPAQGQPGYFEIQASHSGLCAFFSSAGVAEWPCGSSNPAGQFWIWSYNDSDLWTLRPRDGFSLRCWDVPGSSKLPGAQIGLWGCANTPNQLWQIRL